MRRFLPVLVLVSFALALPACVSEPAPEDPIVYGSVSQTKKARKAAKKAKKEPTTQQPVLQPL